MGLSLANTMSNFFPDNRLPEFIVKRVARDVLYALQYCHSQCHLVHTGTSSNVLITTDLQYRHSFPDIKPQNIMTSISGGFNIRASTVLKCIPEFLSCDATAPDGTALVITQSTPVACTPLPQDLEKWKQVRFVLGDFGTGPFILLFVVAVFLQL
jgi:serine/threonine protein kinase